MMMMMMKTKQRKQGRGRKGERIRPYNYRKCLYIRSTAVMELFSGQIVSWSGCTTTLLRGILESIHHLHQSPGADQAIPFEQ